MSTRHERAGGRRARGSAAGARRRQGPPGVAWETGVASFGQHGSCCPVFIRSAAPEPMPPPPEPHPQTVQPEPPRRSPNRKPYDRRRRTANPTLANALDGKFRPTLEQLEQFLVEPGQDLDDRSRALRSPETHSFTVRQPARSRSIGYLDLDRVGPREYAPPKPGAKSISATFSTHH
jgi:hypothetical protein